MNIFNYTNYKLYVNERIKTLPKRGHGEYLRIAKFIGLHTTSVSQIFKGNKDLSLEQAAKLAQYFGLSELESDYFLNLVEFEKAGNAELKVLIEARIRKIKNHSLDLVNRIPKDKILSDSEKAKFYSLWYYSAIRLLVDVPEYQNRELIANRLGLSLKTVNESIDFLLSMGLLEYEDIKLKVGLKRTFIESSSNLVARHHINWRLKTIERFDTLEHLKDFVFTSPMTISIEDGMKIRELLSQTVEKIMKLNSSSKSEDLYILNIDWLKF